MEHFLVAAQAKPDWAQPRKRAAWILATHPDPDVRDPAQAVVLAERAAQLVKRDNASMRDILAAAYAAAGALRGRGGERGEGAAARSQGLEARPGRRAARAARPVPPGRAFVESAIVRRGPRRSGGAGR